MSRLNTVDGVMMILHELSISFDLFPYRLPLLQCQPPNRPVSSVMPSHNLRSSNRKKRIANEDEDDAVVVVNPVAEPMSPPKRLKDDTSKSSVAKANPFPDTGNDSVANGDDSTKRGASSQRLGEIGDYRADERKLCEECQIHVCSEYCMRTRKSQTKRRCRAGAGEEATTRRRTGIFGRNFRIKHSKNLKLLPLDWK